MIHTCRHHVACTLLPSRDNVKNMVNGAQKAPHMYKISICTLIGASCVCLWTLTWKRKYHIILPWTCKRSNTWDKSWTNTQVQRRVWHVLSPILTLKVLNFWKFTTGNYCNLKPLWSGMREVVPARTSPTLHPPSPPTVHQLSWLAL